MEKIYLNLKIIAIKISVELCNQNDIFLIYSIDHPAGLTLFPSLPTKLYCKGNGDDQNSKKEKKKVKMVKVMEMVNLE